MRSRRHGERPITRPNIKTSMLAMPPNQMPLMPPRNRMPMAMQTITPKAPRSGSSSSSRPTQLTAAAIGMNPLVSWCMYCCLRTV